MLDENIKGCLDFINEGIEDLEGLTLTDKRELYSRLDSLYSFIVKMDMETKEIPF
jgi:hypothetical protein